MGTILKPKQKKTKKDREKRWSPREAVAINVHGTEPRLAVGDESPPSDAVDDVGVKYNHRLAWSIDYKYQKRQRAFSTGWIRNVSKLHTDAPPKKDLNKIK